MAKPDFEDDDLDAWAEPYMARRELPAHKDMYELWFEYLRLARRSADPAIKAALKSSDQFYEPWGDVGRIGFEPWWKEHSKLFEVEDSVQLYLDPFDIPPFTAAAPGMIYLEITLDRSPSLLVERVEEIIRSASASLLPDRKKSASGWSKYQLTPGSEPKTLAQEERLQIYRDVYLRNPKAPQKQVLLDAHQLFEKRTGEIPIALRPNKYGDDAKALRSLNRHIGLAKVTVMNVAKGDFPGPQKLPKKSGSRKRA